MRITSEDKILITICYADVFDYPLKESEIWRYLAYGKVGFRRFRKILNKLISEKKVQTEHGFYFSKNRSNLVLLRKKREKISQKKMYFARKAAKILSLIPSVRFVGISGALAMKNVPRDDDIDFFIVTSRHRLWQTRLFSSLILDLFKMRRKPGDRQFRDKICLNMFVDLDHLKVLPNERDLYISHEILQLVPLIDKKQIYKRFLSINLWAGRYLPNIYKEKNKYSNFQRSRLSSQNRLINLFSLVLNLIEEILQRMQLWYMRNKRTSEIVKRGLIKFHPSDARIWIKQKLNVRLIRFKLPLDKIFYAS